MKTNFKRIGKQSISIVLAVMMMLSTMLVGMVTSNAATVSSDGTGILYFNMAAVSWWNTADHNGGNFAYFWGSAGNAWSEKALKYQGDIYYVNIPKGDWTHVILTRNSVTSSPDFTSNLWNKTNDIVLQNDKNYITSFSENSTVANFSTVTPTPDSYSLSADKTTVGTDETVTLTPSFNSKLVSLKSNSYTVKKDGSTASSSDYSISGDSITFNNAGTYTINDTITYNANGYSSITGNVTTDDVTITVNQGTVVTYTIKTEAPVNGTIKVSADSLAAGKTFTVEATPNEGYVLDAITVIDAEGNSVPANDASTHTYTMPESNVTVSATFKEKAKTKYAVVGYLQNLDTKSTEPKHLYANGIKFVDGVAVIDVDAGSSNKNWFAIADDNGNYYSCSNSNVVDYTSETNTKELTSQETTKPDGLAVPWIGKTGVYRLHLVEGSDSTKLNIWVESVTNPWRIYGTTDYFKNWTLASTGDPIALSYKGNANQYYYPVEVTDITKTIYFGLYFNNSKHQPSTGETNTVLTENNKISGIDQWIVQDSQISFEIDPDTTGTYYICVDTATNSVWYEKAQTQPVPVTLNADPVEGGAAYISSYTDNETSEVVTDATGEMNLQTVKAKPNTSVTFMAREVNDYFPMWNVNGKKSTGATFTLDASYVTGTTGVAVYLTYEKIENYNLTIASGEGGSVNYTYDETTGTVVTGVTSSAISVASNKTIKLTANADSANSYVFKGWEFDSDAFSYVSGDSVSPSITISVVGNVNATATFEKRQGNLSNWKFMLSDSDQGLPNDNTGNCQTNYQVYENNGTYSVTFPVSAISSNNTQYLSFSKDGKNSGLFPNNSTFKVEVDDNFKNYVKETENKEWGGYHFPRVQFQNTDDITNIKVTYNSQTQKYIINGTYYTVPTDAHTVYATKGNTRSDGSMQYGTTTISLFGDGKIYKTKDNGSYNEYVVGDGNQITVECKVTDAQAKLGYYVYAFVVNGAKVDVIDTGNNVYQTTAPITVSSDLEITPVYYNKQIEADGNYVTIYTNAPKELQDSWGNSISIYSWYDNNGAEMNGSYPGQLMMRDSQGKFGAKVPKYSYYEDPNGKYVPNTTQKVLGITNNNYSEFQVVHTKFLTTPETQKNHQTYDYDDFEKLTGMGYDTVQFDIKYFPTATDSNQHLLVNDVTDQPSKPNFINKTATPYENLTNIDGKLVSILGYTNETAKAKNHTGLITAEPLQIISVGNQSVKIGEKTTNEWSTIWYVYDSKGNYITQGLPSDFIPRGEFVNNKFVESKNQTDAYKAIKDKNLEYNSAVISYEKEMDATTSTSGRNTGWRIDGRWYYARSVDQVDVNVGIIYRNNNGDKWTVDKPTETSEITGKVTGGSASFDYTDSVGSSHTNLASASVERNTIITLNATNGTQYKFIGWATPTYDADGRVTGYTPLNLTDLNATYSVSTNTELYAMYEPYATGSVTITHSKYTGLDSHNGLGIFFVTAKVFDTNGNLVESQVIDAQSTSNTVTLKDIVNRNDNSYIEVTLTTQSYAKSHFLNFYYPSVSKGVSTLTKDDNIPKFYDKECTAKNPATNTFTVKVSDLFDGDTQKVKALNYYSDLMLPEVESNITFNYNPYNTAPNPNPYASKGTGKTTFTLTITKKDGEVVYTSKSDISSLTLKGNEELKDYLADLTNNDYTITITMNPLADSHCDKGATYRQINTDGAYTYIDTEASTDDVWAYNKDNNTYSASLSDLFDITTQKFKTNTINLYTDFTAEEFNYNVTFKYLGYESREYYNTNGFNQEQIPEGDIDQNWWKTYTASGTFCGADIDKYYNSDTKTFNESFLLKVAPYEDNFVQSITWDLKNAVCSESNDGLSVEATVLAKYKNDSVTVTADLGDGNPSQTHTVNYASLVTRKNLVDSTTQSANDEDYLFVASPTNAKGEKFSYWTIQTDDGIEVAKCYNTTFNYIAYDNYLITACYGKEDVDASKKGVSATMQFLEYSRNQYDTGKDRVYADFAVAYNYDHLLLQESNNSDIVCGVAFVLNSKYKSPGNAVDTFNVNPDDLYAKVRALNDNTATDKKLDDGSKVFNYVINKSSLDNKNRIEYNWSVDNLPANQQLTLLAYSYIYNKTTGKFSVSAPQSFKFYEVGNKSYETQE